MQTHSILLQIIEGDPDPFRSVKKTKHGETRIAKCVKYDLYDFYRLVTIQDGNAITLLFVGNHDDEEAWLDQNRGLVIGASDQEGMGLTKSSDNDQVDNISEGHDVWTGKLLNRLSDHIKNALIGTLPYTQIQSVIDLDSGSNRQTIEASVALIEDQKLQSALLDVLILLNKGEVENAEKRAGIYNGTFKEISDLSDADLISISTGTEIKRIPIGSEEYKSWVDSFINSEKSYEWFLFMHPEQEKYVDASYNGPAKLSGVSGSGKTAIAIARAIRLAKRYENEKILIVTLNRALADLISDIVSDAAGNTQYRNQIEVLSYFDLATNLVHELEPENKKLYTDITLGLEEHKDEIYREFYRCMNNNYGASILKDTHFQLISQGINAENYIAEEFDWIRSTRFRSDREEYLSIERQGRSFPLTHNHRSNILAALRQWEQKMSDVGVIDNLGLTTALGRHLDKIKPKYRSIIVDEAQDFGTTELAIVRKLAIEQENDIFLCGDAAQQVQPKRQNFTRSGINVANRSFKLRKNYRNSKEILQVAYDILVNNLSVEHLENSELEISDPEFAVRSSPVPVLLQANTLEQEIAFAIELMREKSETAKENGHAHSGCIAIAGFSQFEIEEFGKLVSLNVLNGGSKQFDTDIFLSDLEQTKGYEFDTVAILNCNDGVLPPHGVPKQELYRFVSQFYVAMTRAKSQLVLSSSGVPSYWLTNAKIDLDKEPWGDFIDETEIKLIGTPKFLADFPGEDYREIKELSGEQFIFTDQAFGLTSDALEKICSLVREQDTPFAKMENTGGQLKNIGELYEKLTSEYNNSTKQFFKDVEAADFVKNYLGAPIKIDTRLINSDSKVSIKQNTSIKVSTRPQNSQRETPDSTLIAQVNDLRSLDMKASTYAVVFNLGVRSLEDLIKIDSKKLREHLTSKSIRELKSRAKQQLKENAKKLGVPLSKLQTSVRIEDAGFNPRTLKILRESKIKFVEDMRKLSLDDLQKNPKFGQQNYQEIMRIAKNFGISLK